MHLIQNRSQSHDHQTHRKPVFDAFAKAADENIEWQRALSGRRLAPPPTPEQEAKNRAGDAKALGLSPFFSLPKPGPDGKPRYSLMKKEGRIILHTIPEPLRTEFLQYLMGRQIPLMQAWAYLIDWIAFDGDKKLAGQIYSEAKSHTANEIDKLMPNIYPSSEQQARDMLERLGMPGAQSLTAGDVAELAELIARDQKP